MSQIWPWKLEGVRGSTIYVAIVPEYHTSLYMLYAQLFLSEGNFETSLHVQRMTAQMTLNTIRSNVPHANVWHYSVSSKFSSISLYTSLFFRKLQRFVA